MELLADAGLHESAPTEQVPSENQLIVIHIPDLINAGANSAFHHTGGGSSGYAWLSLKS